MLRSLLPMLFLLVSPNLLFSQVIPDTTGMYTPDDIIPDTPTPSGITNPSYLYSPPGLTASSLNIADTADLTLTSLAVPSSPALTLLGISPTIIAKPTDPKDFLVSLANTAQSLTVLPNSFAMEFTPFLVLREKNLDLSEYLENDVVDNFWQTFTISLATNTIDSIPGVSPAVSDVGLAAKFSILRGRVDNKTVQKLATVDSLLSIINSKSFTATDSLLKTLPAYQSVVQAIDTLIAKGKRDSVYQRSSAYTTAISKLSAQLDSFNTSQQFATQSLSGYYSQQAKQLTSTVSGMTFNRVGFMLDAAFGVVYDFPFQQVDSASLTKVGAWLTGSQVINLKGTQIRTLTLQGYARLLNDLDQMTTSPTTGITTTADNTNFDIGAKIDYTSGTKLTLSLEYLQRFVLNNDDLDPTYQYSFSGSYQIAPNYQLSMTFGRGFNGSFTEGGNLLAALHLFGTFGSRKANTALTNN